MSVDPYHRDIENYPPGEELRLMLLGKTGSGKSSLGNALLCERVFDTGGNMVSLTQECEKHGELVRGRYLSIVDTPGTMDTMKPERALRQLSTAIAMFAEHGLHAFVITLRLDMRFTAEEAGAVERLRSIFGDGFYKFAVIAFTHGDAIDNDEGKFFSRVLEARRGLRDLDNLITLCSDRFVMLDCRTNGDPVQQSLQTHHLVQTVDELVRANGARGPVYSNQCFALAQRELQAGDAELDRLEAEALARAIEREKEKVRREFAQRRQAARSAATGRAAEAVFTQIQNENCFPADAVVQTPNGAVRMDELTVGQSVLCVHNNKLTYSPVYMWGHRDHTSWSNSFVTLTTDTAKLTLTSDHLMLIIDDMGDEVSVAACDVCAGETVQVLHNVMSDAACLKHEKVVAVETCVMRRGLFAPFTMEGNLVVNGVLASCYINCLPHAVSHGLLWPVRFSWRLMPSAVDAFNELGDDGMPWWASHMAKRILPRLNWLQADYGRCVSMGEDNSGIKMSSRK